MDVIEASRKALKGIDPRAITRTVHALAATPAIFCIGNGGGHAHATHFASDLRKIAGLRAFSFDNGAELTARVNDNGWASSVRDWIDSHSEPSYMVFMFSVGGANDGLSANLAGAPWGIVGASGAGYHRIVIPSTSTPVIEGCQSVIAHHLVEELCK